jgi:hypothetical protein
MPGGSHSSRCAVGALPPCRGSGIETYVIVAVAFTAQCKLRGVVGDRSAEGVSVTPACGPMAVLESGSRRAMLRFRHGHRRYSHA